MRESAKKAIEAGKDVYLMVVYCSDGGIHLLPCGSKEEAWRNLLRMRRDRKCAPRIVRTTISKKSAASFGDGKIFGSPDSLDVMSMSDKRFAAALERAGIAEEGEGAPLE